MNATPEHSISLSECLYRLLILFYPKEFRQVYSKEMLQTFRDCQRANHQTYGIGNSAQLWGFLLRDLVISIPFEHYKTFITQWKRLFSLESKEYATMATGFPFHLTVGQHTDIGRQRKNNEDSLLAIVPEDSEILAKKGALFVVSDGLGGHENGEIASTLAVRTINEKYYEDTQDSIPDALRLAIQQANAEIHQAGKEMGTTCVVAVLQGDTVHIANVGDSRAYLERAGQLRQLSRDHSIVADELRAGLITKEQARHHPQLNVITRCLGTDNTVEVDTFSESVQDGDRLLLCTDGLTNLVEEEELARIVQQFQPAESVNQLILRANEEGGPDNITAIVVQVSPAA